MNERPTDSELADLCGRLQAMPQQMRERKQWLLWRAERYDGDKKPRKVPYYVSGRKRHGAQGTDEDRRELATFEIALTHLRRGHFTGMGFAFLPGDGLIGIDIDGAIDAETGEVSERCRNIVQACDSYTELSPSGRGVHIIVAGESETFKDNSVGVEVFCGRQYFTCTGSRWSGAPDAVRPIGETTLRRLKATVRTGKEARRSAAPPAAAVQVTGSRSDLAMWLDQALAVLDSGRLSYDEWIGIGMALKSALGDAGMAAWDYWSSKGGERYCGPDKIAQHWKSFAGTDTDGAQVIFRMARRGNAWRPPKAWHEVYGKARELRRAHAPARPGVEGASTPSTGSARGGGGPPGDEPPTGDPPDGDDWPRKLLRTSEGGKKDCRENVFVMMMNHPALKGLVGFDEFAHQVVKLRPPPWDSTQGEWSTNDDYLLGYWLARHERLTIKAEATLVAGVAMAAFAARFNPLLDYLRGLPKWDGIERLRHWLPECLGAEDSEYTQLVGTWFIMGMVKRALEPGCQMDYMVVLEGRQGKRKSTALRTLVGRDEWFADTPIRIGDKDAMLSLAGKWLYEVGELDSFNKAEVTAVKQYVSSRIDRVREPFARRPADRKRSGVFGGTTNQSEYFKDPTGARRFWPVACDGEIDVELIAQWRDQLYAEAMHRLASDDADLRRYYPTREETERLLVPQQERREIGDPWFEKLASWLDSKAPYGESGLEVREVDSFTSFELLTRCLNVPMDRIDGSRQMATRVGIAMHRLGWAKERDSSGARVWRYWRPGAGKGKGKGGSTASGGPDGDGDQEVVLHEF